MKSFNQITAIVYVDTITVFAKPYLERGPVIYYVKQKMKW